MAYDYNVSDTATNGGGEGSTTGNTLGYQLPSNPTNVIVKIKRITIDNNSLDPIRFLADLDSATIGTAMGAVADMASNVGHSETVILEDGRDFNNRYAITGIVYQAVAASAGTPDVKVTIEVDVKSAGGSF